MYQDLVYFKYYNFMGNKNYTHFLSSPQLEKFYDFAFEEQFKEVLHVRKVSEGLFTFVTGETALITGLKQQEHSVELQFESKKLVIVLQNAFFEEEYLHYKDKSDLFIVTLEERTLYFAEQKDISIKYVSIIAFKELVEQQGGKYMKVLVERW